MPTIVFVADDAIHPITSGGRLELHGELRALRIAGVTVHLIVFHRERISAEDRGRTSELVESVTFVPRVDFTRATIRRPLSPFQLSSRALSATTAAAIVAGAGGEIDAVLASHEWTLPTAQLVSEHAGGAPILLRSHNDESAYYRSLARHARGPKRVYLWAESVRIRVALARRSLWRGVRAVAVISSADAGCYARLGVPVTTVPPTFEVSPAPRRSTPLARRSVGFVGALDSSHTEEGLRWFVREVFAPLHAQDPTTELIVAGRRASEDLTRQLQDQAGVEFLGEIDDPLVVYAAARVFVNPIFSGSGVNMKVGPPIALGLPVVSTSVGARGLDVLSTTMTITDDAELMRRAISMLLDDDGLCAHRSMAGARALAFHQPAVTGALLRDLLSPSGGAA